MVPYSWQKPLWRILRNKAMTRDELKLLGEILESRGEGVRQYTKRVRRYVRQPC